MNRLFVTANHYYSVLERFGLQYILKSPWPWLWIVLLLVFIAQGFAFVTSGTKLNGTALFLDWQFLSLIVLEFAILAVSNKLQSDKAKVVLERVNSKYRQSFSSIEQARRFLLQRFFGRHEAEYLAFADDIQKAITYQDQLRNPLAFGFSRILLFLYDPDSKQRIYALLVVVVSVLTALSIREGGSISGVFEFFAGEKLALVVFVWLLLVVFLAGLLTLLLVIRLGVEVLWAYLSVRLDGKAARNPYTLKYLQRDLLAFHRFVHLRGAQEG
ncbi:MAG: hypothetical protein H3C26_17705 [Rhodocyclaceae bacterium]|nr:hypothetical protein [Rhodocyclaceae bacterium]